MYKAKGQFLGFIYRVIDIIVVALSFVIAFEIRKSLSFQFLFPFEEPITGYFWHLAAILFAWWHLLNFNKVYTSYRGKPKWMVIVAVLKANLQGLLLLGFALFFLKEYWFHRTFIIIFVITSACLLSAEKAILFYLLRRIRKIDKNIKNVLIIGTGKRGKYLLDLFTKHQDEGFRILGFLGNNPGNVGKTINGAPILGVSDDLQSFLHKYAVDEVFIAISMRFNDQVNKMILECEQFGINVRIMPNIVNPLRASIYFDELLDTPFITYTTRPLKVYQFFCKDVIDILAALMLTIILMPLFLIIAVLIKLDSRGPVFFKQDRAGLNGRKFVIYKFRSMVENAESQRFQLENLNELDGPVFKIKNDPRITRAGRFLRKTSLDELPQLFNVLRGEISLVGPRPLFMYESDKISGVARRRLSMKPGITGLWQVSGRNEVDFDKWMELDLEYIDNWSLWLDVKILLKTLRVLFSGKGAY